MSPRRVVRGLGRASSLYLSLSIYLSIYLSYSKALVKLHGNNVPWEQKALAPAPALTPTHEALFGRTVYVPTYNSLAQEPVEFVILCGISMNLCGNKEGARIDL